jgi:CRISPR-associated endonuclease/helicase Cas3
MDFPEVARRFRLVDDDTDDVVVPYGDAQAQDAVKIAIDALKSKRGRARELMRRIHPYTVGLRSRDITRAASRGLVAPVIDGVWEWTGPAARYDQIQGLIGDGIDEELLIG